MEIAKRAQVLIAADVVYDRAVIPPLVSSVGRLLSESSERIAIFATTYRNEETFALFQSLSLITMMTEDPEDHYADT